MEKYSGFEKKKIAEFCASEDDSLRDQFPFVEIDGQPDDDPTPREKGWTGPE